MKYFNGLALFAVLYFALSVCSVAAAPATADAVYSFSPVFSKSLITADHAFKSSELVANNSFIYPVASGLLNNPFRINLDPPPATDFSTNPYTWCNTMLVGALQHVGIQFDLTKILQSINANIVNATGGGQELKFILAANKDNNYFCEFQPGASLADCQAKIGRHYQLSTVTEADFSVGYIGSNSGFAYNGISFSKGSIPIGIGLKIIL